MGVEVEIRVTAAKPAHIDDAPEHLGRAQVLARDLAGDLVDDEVDALAVGCLQHLIDPAGIAGINGEIRAKVLQPVATAGIGR